jgi:hypothetical protein
MTLAIQRQPRFNNVLLVVGLIALVASLAVAMNRVAEPTDAGNPAVVPTHNSAGLGHRFEATQDDYLVPQSIPSRQAAMQAELRLQDGYLPSSAVVDSAGAAFLSIQDGYLPPAGWAPTVEPTDDPAPTRFGRR